VTDANVNSLVAVYAIGVFTGFTMAGAGMVRYHTRTRQQGWRRRSVINGSAAVLSLAVVLIFAITKFTEGAWVVLLLFPVMMVGLLRLNRRYREEAAAVSMVSARFARMANFQRTVAVVMINDLDLTSLRALRYARSLRATEMRAVHFMLDSSHARLLQENWAQMPSSDIPLDVVDCPDRRLVRAALKFTVSLAEEEGTHVTVLLPRRTYSPLLGRLLHDRTADRIAAAVSRVRGVAATIVPFDPTGAVLRYGRRGSSQADEPPQGDHGLRVAPAELEIRRRGDRGVLPHRKAKVKPGHPSKASHATEGAQPIGDVHYRQRAKVAGQVRVVETRPMSGTPVLEVTVADDTGGLRLLFYGRRSVPGIEPGARIVAEGMVTAHKGHLAICNPSYQLLPVGDPGEG
jgi:hypothetical protein